MKPISELDKAQLKHEMRTLYKDLGFTASFQVIYELLIAADTMLEVISEENNTQEK